MYDTNNKDTIGEGKQILDPSRGQYNKGTGLSSNRKWIELKQKQK